jgi:DNA end-binding protein Ku
MASPGRVVDLMEALRRSVGGTAVETKASKKPTKKPTKKPARRRPARRKC